MQYHVQDCSRDNSNKDTLPPAAGLGSDRLFCRRGSHSARVSILALFRYTIANKGTQALPPSFTLAAGKPDHQLGCRWLVFGLLRHAQSQLDFEKYAETNSFVSVDFNVGYSYTTPPPQSVSPKLKRCEKMQVTIDPIISSPLCKLVMRISFNGELKMTSVKKITVQLYQNIKAGPVSAIHLSLQSNMNIFESIIDNSYACESSNAIPIDVEVGNLKLNMTFKKHALFATTNCFSEVAENLVCADLASSTYSQGDSNNMAISVTYFVKTSVLVHDPHFLGPFRTFVDICPVTLSHSLGITTDSEHRAMDVFTPILCAIYKDIILSIPLISELADGPLTVRPMATTMSDHAQILLLMLNSLNSQMNFFTSTHNSLIVNWPKRATPVNMFILELEMLLQAAPPPYDQQDSHLSNMQIKNLLNLVGAYMKTALELVRNWMEHNPVVAHAQRWRDTIQPLTDELVAIKALDYLVVR